MKATQAAVLCYAEEEAYVASTYSIKSDTFTFSLQWEAYFHQLVQSLALRKTVNM